MSSPTNDPRLFERARWPLGYAKRGWHVFPLYEVTPAGVCACGKGPDCGNPGKHPRTANGFKAATTDPDQIKRWIAKYPTCNWGIACGASKLLVVDVDPRNGGDENLAEIERQHSPLPHTLTALTGGGGQHYIFRWPTDEPVRSTVLALGVEIKSEGGYIVAQPSTHVSGKPYQWDSGAHPNDTAPELPPDWLLRLIGNRKHTEQYERGGEVTDGFLGAAFDSLGWLGGGLGPDKARAQCPWEHEHTGGHRFDSSTVIFAPSKGKRTGFFYCSHAHCQGRSLKQVLDEIPESAKVAARQALGLDPLYNPEAESKSERQIITPDSDEWARVLRFNEHGQVTRDMGNAALILANLDEWRGALQYDEFADRIRWVRPVPDMSGLAGPRPGEDIADHHVTYVHHWLAKFRGVSFPKSAVQDALVAAARKNSVHPVREYLNSLTWDRNPRACTWLSTYLGADATPYVHAVGRWWLISAIARIFDPGCQVDHILVLEGQQGAGKSTAVRILMGEWYLPSLPDITSKDAAQVLQGHWGGEIGELDAFKGAAGTRVKDWLTRTVDTFRPAYGRFTERRYRQCVFIGTTNEHQYLTDSSGARRFWPVGVRGVDRDALIRDRDQIWAEARTYYDSGETWWPDEALRDELADVQEDRYAGDEWEARLAKWAEGLDGFTLGEALSSLGLDPGQWGRREQTRAGQCLRRVGFSVRQQREGDVRVRRYYRMEGA